MQGKKDPPLSRIAFVITSSSLTILAGFILQKLSGINIPFINLISASFSAGWLIVYFSHYLVSDLGKLSNPKTGQEAGTKPRLFPFSTLWYALLLSLSVGALVFILTDYYCDLPACELEKQACLEENQRLLDSLQTFSGKTDTIYVFQNPQNSKPEPNPLPPPSDCDWTTGKIININGEKGGYKVFYDKGSIELAMTKHDGTYKFKHCKLNFALGCGEEISVSFKKGGTTHDSKIYLCTSEQSHNF